MLSSTSRKRGIKSPPPPAAEACASLWFHSDSARRCVNKATEALLPNCRCNSTAIAQDRRFIIIGRRHRRESDGGDGDEEGMEEVPLYKQKHNRTNGGGTIETIYTHIQTHEKRLLTAHGSHRTQKKPPKEARAYQSLCYPLYVNG